MIILELTGMPKFAFEMLKSSFAEGNEAVRRSHPIYLYFLKQLSSLLSLNFTVRTRRVGVFLSTEAAKINIMIIEAYSC